MSAATLILFPLVQAAQSQVVRPPSPKDGSSNPISAEALQTRPATTPCKVPLFTNLKFADFNAKSFSYTPPAACPGPWAKVVFTADFTVTPGIQYDRTAAFYLGHANIYYGTTAEPSPTQSPSWHVEHDVTDLSAIFKSAQTGEADLGNLVNSTYTGIIYANAQLEFYPTSAKYPAKVTPDVIVPLPDAAGGAAALYTSANQLTQTVTLPTNVERAYLDVIAQSQSGDEFWYTCVPNDVTGPLESCGGTGFRETEITIDGKAAGVAPVYPWIYTGGLDPYLWIPITGVQTLDFKPYRVDLTPFAGLLANGSPHTVGVSVFNANSYFLATANLLVYTDHGKDVVTGGLISDTLSAAPAPKVVENLNLDSSNNGYGVVWVGSRRTFAISGYVNTSHGLVTTTVQQELNFLSEQQFILNPSVYQQNIIQTSTVASTTTTTSPNETDVTQANFSYPLNLKIKLAYDKNGGGVQTVTSDQKDLTDIFGLTGSTESYSVAQEEVKTTDSLAFDSSFNITGESGMQSSATDVEYNSDGQDYVRSLTAKNGVLTGYSAVLPKQ